MTSPCLAHGCSACCHDTQMPLTEEDAARLEALGHARAAFTTRGEGNVLQLANVDGACFFLREGKCSVYDARPVGCTIYPFVMTDDGKRVLRDEDCPHRREFPHDATALRRIRVIHGTLLREAARRPPADAVRSP